MLGLGLNVPLVPGYPEEDAKEERPHQQSVQKRAAVPKRRPLAKQKWTTEEEHALQAGVSKYGTGKWRQIQQDPAFGQTLARRSNVDLKDKWRNLQMDSQAAKARRHAFSTDKATSAKAPSSRKRRRPTEDEEDSVKKRARGETVSSPRSRRTARNAPRRRFGIEFSEGDHYDAEVPKFDLEDESLSFATNSDSEDSEISKDSQRSQASTFSTNLTQAAVLILQTAQNSPVSVSMVIDWLKKALHKDTVNEAAVARKLQRLEVKQRLKSNAGSYQLAGFGGEICEAAAQYTTGEGNERTPVDPFRDANGDMAERALTMMQKIREAEFAARYATQLRESADQMVEAARRNAQLAMDGEVEGPFRMQSYIEPEIEEDVNANPEDNPGDPEPQHEQTGFFQDAEDSTSSKSYGETLHHSENNLGDT